jgi:hypothetical protein
MIAIFAYLSFFPDTPPGRNKADKFAKEKRRIKFQEGLPD